MARLETFVLTGKYGQTLLFALAAALVAFSADVSAPVTDNFHEGELLGFLWHLRDYYQGTADFPVLVHGAMDYLPEWFAFRVFGFDRTIVGTHVIVMLLTALQYLLLLHTCYLLTDSKNHRTLWTLLLLLYFYYVTPQFDASVIEASYFPLRDLFLSLTLWCLVNSALAAGSLQARCWLAAGSVSTVVALYWCYNRGLITLAFVGVFWLGLLARRKIGSAILMLAVLVATAAILDRLRVFGTLRENASNILYWLKYGAEVNRPRFLPEYAPGIAGLAALCLLALAVLALALAARRKIRFDNDLLAAFVAGLFVVLALNIKVVFGVPDLEYALHGGWPAVMLLLVYGSRLVTVDTSAVTRHLADLRCQWTDSGRPARLALALAGVALLGFLAIAHHHAFLPFARFAKNLVRPVANAQILPHDILDVSRVVAESGDDCYFNWVNDDVVAFLAGKKHCTDFPYAHYAGISHEQRLLAQLQAAAPSLIILEEDFWPFTRYQERMADRLPATARYIAENYGQPATIGNYRVVFRNP